MEKIEQSNDELDSNKLEEFQRVNELYQRCVIWSMKHNKQQPRDKLSESEAELQDIAEVLQKLMAGKNPFRILRKDHLLDMPEDWIHRMGAYLLTNNKKRVSDLFCLQDDGKSLTQYLASRAPDFLSPSELHGLTSSQRLKKLVEIIEHYPDTKEHYIGLFEDYFDDWVADKQAQDVAFKRYTFEEWKDIAIKRKK